VNLRVVGFFLALAVGVASWVLTCAAWKFDRAMAGFLPLEPRAFGRFTVVVLGTAAEGEDPGRRGTTVAAGIGGEIALVDAGRGVAEALRAAKIPPSQPGAVLLTSLLPENTVGLDDLLASAWLAGRRAPLRVLGPSGTAALAQHVVAEISAGVVARARALGDDPAPPALEAVEIADGAPQALGGLALRAGALAGGPLPALAWRIEAGGRSAVVGGTGWDSAALEELARGANLLLHDANHVPTPAESEAASLTVDPERLKREAALYTDFADVGAIARRAGVGALVLIRMRQPPVIDLQITSRVDDEYDGRISVAHDGDEFTP
jgi:ribonuclease BN (tRNA processing enzyme)